MAMFFEIIDFGQLDLMEIDFGQLDLNFSSSSSQKDSGLNDFLSL